MATRRIGLSRGETFRNITEAVGAATVTDNIELTFDLAVGLTKKDVLLAIEAFRDYVVKSNWPPA